MTAHALYALTAPGGEFLFNCYPLNDQGLVRWVRFHLIYQPLRAVLSRMPFALILAYSRLMALLSLIPSLGVFLEKSYFCVTGDVPKLANESARAYAKRHYKNTALNTFDCYGSHSFQHHKSDDEIRALVKALQPDESKVLNMDKYFQRPAPIGCALRVFR
jgi:hypothetical protein